MFYYMALPASNPEESPDQKTAVSQMESGVFPRAEAQRNVAATLEMERIRLDADERVLALLKTLEGQND